MPVHDAAVAPTDDAMAGTSYKSIRSIGSGAMGEVIEAEHLGLGKRVVVKLLRAEYGDSAPILDRFRLESQALAHLDQHPNIVQVFDCGRTGAGRPFLVMERLEGRTLREEMQARGGPFEPQEAADLMRQLLAGLAAAHAGEIVHRDIKPSNLFLCAPDDAGARRLKILDFGIAKVLRHRGEDRGPAPLALPTAEGITIGTPRFLAPEQALGRPVDGRTDLYSAGAVLYWMLTGKDPFHDAVGEFAIIRAHATRRPAAPSTLAKGSVPAALDQAVLKALAKDPVDRYATAAEFSAAIAASLATRPAPRDWASTEPVDTAAIRAKPALPFTARAAPAAAPPPVIPREVLRAAFREHGTGADQDGDPTRVLPAVAPAPSGAGEVAREDGPAPAAPSRFRPRLRGALTVILVAMGLAVLLGLAFRGAWPVR